MEISQSDFRNWHEHPVTQVFKKDMLEAIDQQLAFLLSEAGLDPLKDRFRVGAVQGLRSLVEWQPEVIEEGTDAIDREGTPATD